MVTPATLAAVRAFVRNHLFSTGPAQSPRYPFVSASYRWLHTLGVARYAVHIARAEGADEDACHLAALFHDACYFDCDRYDGHPQAGAALARRYLTGQGFDRATVQKVERAVLDHAGRGAAYWASCPLEVQILVEADLLDKIGPAGAAAHLLHYGSQGEDQLAALERLRRELLERAEGSTGILFTATGRRLAGQQIDRLRRFVAEWAAELPPGDGP